MRKDHDRDWGDLVKIAIVCFSQTGNTRKVAEAMASVFSGADHEVRILSLNKDSYEKLTDAHLIGVGTPCFVSQAPGPVKKYLKKLPEMNGIKAFVFSTSGGAPGRVLYDLAVPLRQKGIDIIGGHLSRGTCFHPIPCLVGRFPGRPDGGDITESEQFASAILHHIESGIPGSMPESRQDAFRHGYGFYQMVGAILKDPLVRFLMPKPKVELRVCNECGWCVRECPTGSIRLAPKPVITGTCIRCYRCMNGCPENALWVKWGISNFLVWLFYNTTFERWFGDVRPGEKLY